MPLEHYVVFPYESPESMPLILKVLSRVDQIFINSPKCASSLSLIEFPFSFVLPAVAPPQLTLPMHVVLSELSFVARAIPSVVMSIPMLQAFQVFSFITVSVRSHLLALAMLLTGTPLSHISSSIILSEPSKALISVIKSLSFIEVSIAIDQAAPAVCHVVYKGAYILRAVSPELFSISMSFFSPSAPLAFIDYFVSYYLFLSKQFMLLYILSVQRF